MKYIWLLIITLFVHHATFNSYAEAADTNLPDGLYYSGSDGSIYVIDNDGNSSLIDTEKFPHTLQLVRLGDRIYGASAGTKFTYSGTPDRDGDGKLFYLFQSEGRTVANVVLDNTGANHNRDPYGLAVYNDDIYVYDRNESVRKISYGDVTVSQDYPSWLENDWIDFYGTYWMYGCIKSGMQITETINGNGDTEPVFWLTMKFNGHGLYRFKEVAVSKNGFRNSDFNRSYLVNLISTSFFFDETNDHLYIYKETRDHSGESGLYRIKISDLARGDYWIDRFFYAYPPELIDGSPVRNEGTEAEHIGIPQLSADAEGQYLYWCYRAPTSDDDYESYLFKERYDPANPMHRTGIKRIKLGEENPTVEMVVESVDGYGVVALNYKKAGQDAVSDITFDETNEAPVEYYNLQGLRINYPQPGSILIRRQGDSVAKIRF